MNCRRLTPEEIDAIRDQITPIERIRSERYFPKPFFADRPKVSKMRVSIAAEGRR